jgi:hypothetical protein
MDLNKIPLEPRQLGVPSGASKTISDPMVRLAQAMTNTNTTTEQTKTGFHMSQITYEFHPLLLK